MHFFYKYRYLISIIIIILVASILRFYNYGNRWGLAYDQARDVTVAREAIHSFRIPLIGPFASAGQFVYGPQWFWILIIFIIIYPFSLLGPWVLQTIIYVAIVYLMIRIGTIIENKLFGVIAGILVAVSPGQIDQAINLTSPSMVGIFSAISLFFFVLYINKQRTRDAFFMAFFIANSINIHFQAISMLALIPIAFVLDTKRNYRKICILILGTIIPFIPIFIFDIKNNFFESRNWFDYYLHGQYQIYVPNRWLTYAGVFWPSQWANIIGGQNILGYFSFGLLPLLLLVALIKRNISRSFFSVIIAFFIIFIMLRYYRGERIASYFVFLHPYVILLTSWIVYKLYKLNYIIGVIFVLMLISGSLAVTVTKIKNAENFTSILSEMWKKELVNKYPNKKFAVYDYEYARKHNSLPLVLFLDSDKKIADNGVKIGLTIQTGKVSLPHKSIIGSEGGYQLLDLNSSSSAELSKEGWAFVNPSAVYNSTVEWYKKK